MENNGKILCKAIFKCQVTMLAMIFSVLWWIVGAVLHVSCSYTSDNSKEAWGITYYSKDGTYFPVSCEEGTNKSALAIVILIDTIIIAIPFIIFIIRKVTAKRCSLSLSENQIEGQLKTTFGNKKLQMPIDHLDSVMTSNGFMDKVRCGETLLISSNSGLIRFHYVQNAGEFAQAAMKRINEVKKSVPAVAPAPAQSVSGSDAMEKINSLKQMLDAGLITQEDFDQKKKDILSKM